MTRRIYKYEIPFQDRYAIPLPINHIVLDIQLQRDVICLWAIVPVEANYEPAAPFVLRIFGTGHEIEDKNLRYIKSVQMTNSNLMWHIFQEMA